MKAITGWWNRLSRRGKGITIAVAAVLVIAGAASAGQQDSPTAGGVGKDQTDQPTATATPTPPATAVAEATPTVAPTAVAKLTADQLDQVRTILTASIKHYQDAMTAGKKALGTTQYADAFEGLAAMDDPTSNAAKVRDWRSNSQIEEDVSYLDAFGEADAFYNADNEPAAIADWEFDMGDLTAAINQWIQTAVSWQISEVTDAELAAADAAVTDAFKVVQADVDKTVSQSR
jgi:hypothetical protein